MERADLVEYLALSADELVSRAEFVDSDNATELLQEAGELIALGSILLQKDKTSKLSIITKEAA